MEPKIKSSQALTKPQQDAPAPSPKILTGTSQNYIRVPKPGDNCIRPLMVNAWSQTTTNDFSALWQVKQTEEHTKREKELLEKKHKLESDLRAHVEVLSQIHATSARTAALLGQPTPPPLIKPLQIQTVESQSSSPHTSSRTIPEQLNSHNSPTSPGINPLHSTPTESVKYTLIAEGLGYANGEPIEIQLTEDDCALNLSSSTDSGRLEICLAPENSAELKTESIQAPLIDTTMNNSGASSSEHNYFKKSCSKYQNDDGRGVALPSSNSRAMYTSRKRRSNNGYLKQAKSIKVNGAPQIQTTSIQPLMPSGSHNSSAFIGSDRKSNTVSIGPNNTPIPSKVYASIDWRAPSIATRKLLLAVFDRKTLATHSLTGKPSPAFKDHNKPLKKMLDPLIIQDIISCVKNKCNVSEKEVRNAITSKCADENKILKQQANRLDETKEINKENNGVECVHAIKSEF